MNMTVSNCQLTRYLPKAQKSQQISAFRNRRYVDVKNGSPPFMRAPVVYLLFKFDNTNLVSTASSAYIR